MLGEGTLTRLIKVYNPVAAGEDLGGIRERERKGGKEERREVEKERGKKNKPGCLRSVHCKEDRALTFSFCLCCVRSSSVTFSSWKRKFN